MELAKKILQGLSISKPQRNFLLVLFTTILTVRGKVNFRNLSRYSEQRRYGQSNQHNAPMPRDFWLTVGEKERIIAFHLEHPQEGYRRLTFLMLDRDIVAVSASSVYRVLQEVGLIQRWERKPSKKGTGFEQPTAPHEHWHIDISYLNICGTFYYQKEAEDHGR